MEDSVNVAGHLIPDKRFSKTISKKNLGQRKSGQGSDSRQEAPVDGQIVVQSEFGFGFNFRTTRLTTDTETEIEQSLEEREKTTDQSEGSESPAPPRTASPTETALTNQKILSVLVPKPPL